jgi:Hsp70 protein
MIEPPNTPPVYGLDFGMTTSSLAVSVDDGPPRLVEDPAVPAGGAYLVPTSVLFDQPSETFLVGTAALNARAGAPGMFRDRFKRLVGTHESVFVGEREFPLERVVSEVLGFLRAQALRIVPEAPATVVLAVPASWRPDQWEFMKRAADQAGFSRRAIIMVDEPTAAFEYARTLTDVDDGRPVLIYDLGGSTFDCALLVPDDGSGQPQLFRDGLSHLGGVDFDDAVLEELTDRYQQVREFRDTAPDQSVAMDRLRRTCERIKQRLSEIRDVEEKLTELPGQPIVTISRGRFDTLIDGNIRKTIQVCRQLLNENGIEASQLRAVVPVGGSSRIPLVRTQLRELAPGAVIDVPEPELAVTLGALSIARERQHSEPHLAVSTPITFGEPATREPAKIVGVPTSTPPGKTSLIVAWIFSIAWGGLLGGLAATQWSLPITGAVAAIVLLCLVGMITLTPRPKSTGGWPWVVATVVFGAVVPLAAAIIYAYRTLGEGYHDWPLVGWAAAVVACAITAAVAQASHTTNWEQERATQARAEQLAAIESELRGERWFGQSDRAPELFTKILTIPAVRVFDIGAADGDGFQFAVTSGTIALLVHVAASTDARPRLTAAAQGWTKDLTNALPGAEVTGLIVFPGNRVPPMPERVRARLGAQLTSARAFTDVVGNWLAEGSVVDVRLAEPLLRSTRATN